VSQGSGARPRVLAIGIDAAEPALIREMLGRGELPHLASLLESGRLGRVVSPAWIGSGTVWPTFVSGRIPLEHGIHSRWSWDPKRMRVVPVSVDHIRPFWTSRELEGFSVGVFDMPWAPMADPGRGFQVSEWGPYDSVHGQTEVSPANLRALIEECGGGYPFSRNLDGRGKVAGRKEMARLVSECMEAVRLRGALAERLMSDLGNDLFLVVFNEVHRAVHFVWHAAGANRSGGPGLLDLCREVDRQVGRLVAAADPGAAVLVFSLHGIRDGGGVPMILDPLLRASGLATVPRWRDAPAREKVSRALTAVKRRAPLFVKKTAYRLMSRALAQRTLSPALVPPYDWSRTAAFPLMSDQHGWIRVNLAGREARGIVPPERYRETCREIERLLRGLVTEEGRPVVRDVHCLGESRGEAPARLPDLVVNWSDAAMVPVLRLRTPAVSASLTSTKMTGQHAPEGFFIFRPGSTAAAEPEDPVAAEDLHRLIVSALPRATSAGD
jgi:predicted AlkP superfamily phosphohydrolase/phosphomutase